MRSASWGVQVVARKRRQVKRRKSLDSKTRLISQIEFLMGHAEYVTLERIDTIVGLEIEQSNVKVTLGGDRWESDMEPSSHKDLEQAVQEMVEKVREYHEGYARRAAALLKFSGEDEEG